MYSPISKDDISSRGFPIAFSRQVSWWVVASFGLFTTSLAVPVEEPFALAIAAFLDGGAKDCLPWVHREAMDPPTFYFLPKTYFYACIIFLSHNSPPCIKVACVHLVLK
jgi:hypothetical protein